MWFHKFKGYTEEKKEELFDLVDGKIWLSELNNLKK
jgi:hypothetical protein